jgi:anti-anti-sigma factor
MEMSILEQSDSLTRVALLGRLDTAGVDQIELKFNAAIAPRGKNTVVDFSGVTFLSSMGVRMLLTMARSLNHRKARLVLQAPQELVLESIRHAALEDLIPVAADEAAARALLQQ